MHGHDRQWPNCRSIYWAYKCSTHSQLACREFNIFITGIIVKAVSASITSVC